MMRIKVQDRNKESEMLNSGKWFFHRHCGGGWTEMSDDPNDNRLFVETCDNGHVEPMFIDRRYLGVPCRQCLECSGVA